MLRANLIKTATKTVNYTAVTLLFASFHLTAANLHQDHSHIKANSLNNISGSTAVNMAAGNNNAQANTASIAIGQNAKAINRSTITVSPSVPSGIASSIISGNTFHNAKGITAINQVSGSGNAQLNDITMAFGDNIEVVSDASLMIHLPSRHSNENAETSLSNTVYLDKDSLKGASGSIQVNQIAGSGNIAVNRVSMPIK